MSHSYRNGDGQGAVDRRWSNVTLYLTAIGPIHLDVRSVLCPLTDTVELASTFTARIIVFDIQGPILAGTSVTGRSSALGRVWFQWPTASLTADRALPSFSRRSGGDISRTERHVGPRFRCCYQAEPSVCLRFANGSHTLCVVTPPALLQRSDERHLCRGSDHEAPSCLRGPWCATLMSTPASSCTLSPPMTKACRLPS